MSYNGKKVIRAIGRIKGGVGIMILQYANLTVEVVRVGSGGWSL